MQTGKLRYIWLLSILFVFVFACRAFTGAKEDVDTARATVQSVATDIQQGRNFLGTAQAITTQVGGSSMIRTVQALATQADESGLLATAQAFATEQGPGLIETVMAVATQEGPSLLGTARAYITESAPGTPPPDIPIMDGQKEMFYQSPEFVSYVVSAPYPEAVEFYKTQMPLSGWTKVEQDWVEEQAIANLQFEKAYQKASVVLTASTGGDKTTVLITIGPK